MNTLQQTDMSLFHRLCDQDNNFKIATHNVRNCIANEKRNQIEQFFTENNLDILGLSETHITLQHSYSITKNFKSSNLPFKYILLNENRFPNCQGVSFLVSSFIEKHIFNYQGFYDRIIFIDLQMKNKQKLRIIQIYFPADTKSTKAHLNRVKIQNKLLDIIIEAKLKGYHHILMGNFNIDIKKITLQPGKRNIKIISNN